MSEPVTVERERPLLTVPDLVVDLIDHYERQPAESNVYSDDQAEISRLYAAKEHLPNIGVVEFQIEFRHYFEDWHEDFDMVSFRYDTEDKIIAEFQFLLMPDGRFQLSHRLVDKAARGQGIGERLLRQSEMVLQTLADKRKQPLKIFLQLGQRSTLQWFLKRGYAPEPGHVQTVESVLQHPERYVFDRIQPSNPDDSTVREDGIFLPETAGRSVEKTVRMNLEKTLQPN